MTVCAWLTNFVLRFCAFSRVLVAFRRETFFNVRKMQQKAWSTVCVDTPQLGALLLVWNLLSVQ